MCVLITLTLKLFMLSSSFVVIVSIIIYKVYLYLIGSLFFLEIFRNLTILKQNVRKVKYTSNRNKI